jgi:hypothetical protein
MTTSVSSTPWILAATVLLKEFDTSGVLNVSGVKPVSFILATTAVFISASPKAPSVFACTALLHTVAPTWFCHLPAGQERHADTSEMLL